jgi:hypothetical protein
MMDCYAMMYLRLVIEWQGMQKIESGKGCEPAHKVSLVLIIKEQRQCAQIFRLNRERKLSFPFVGCEHNRVLGHSKNGRGYRSWMSRGHETRRALHNVSDYGTTAICVKRQNDFIFHDFPVGLLA